MIKDEVEELVHNVFEEEMIHICNPARCKTRKGINHAEKAHT